MSWRTRALAVALALATWALTDAAVAADNAGQSGVVAWEVVDVVQSRLTDEQATRWDFVVALKLTAPGEIRFERAESGTVNQAPRQSPLKARLRAGETLRMFHWERVTGADRRDVYRRYIGRDDQGKAVTVEAIVRLNAALGARKPVLATGHVAAPAIDAPLPPDLRVLPPAAGMPARFASFSGVWTGKWMGSDRPAALIVEEVGPRDAIIVYSLGAAGNRPPAPVWFRRKARMTNDLLVVELSHAERVVYARSDNGLAGTWTHDDGRTGRVALARPTAAARPAPNANLARAARLNAEALTALLDGQFVDALPRAQEALAVREAALGGSHPDVAVSLTTLAEVYRGQGRLDDAERLHRRALGIREARFGREHPDVAASLNHLAVLYNARATYREAEGLLTRALEIVDKGKGAGGAVRTNRVKAEILDNLARVYRAQGRPAEAEEAQAKAAILWAIQ